jgi:uncharacterized protein
VRHLLPGSLTLGLLVLLAAGADVAVPELTAHVTDLTATLRGDERAALEEKLAAFEAGKGSQVAVLIVPTTRPEAIEQYSLRVVERWKLGRKGVDDGALLLIAKEDRELRIEVGYGLEGVLTDAVSRRIIDETIVPSLRQGDFYRGIDAGVDRMLGVIHGERLPEPECWRGPPLEDLLPLIPIVLVFTITLGSILKAILGQLAGALMTGALVTGFTWLLLGILGAAVIAGVAVFVLTLFSRHQPRRWSNRGGPGWSGGSGGGRGGGGGFGGGGGGFGGGGASGRW